MSAQHKFNDLHLAADRLRQDEFFFASSHRTIRARCAREIECAQQSDAKSILAATSAAWKAGLNAGNTPVVVGAIPFSQRNRASLFLADEAIDLSSAEIALASDAPTGGYKAAIREIPEPQAYLDAVSAALRMLEGDIGKIVLARTLEMHLDRPVDLPSLLRTLVGRNPSGYTFSVPRVREGVRSNFIGGSPELLLRKSGSQIVSNPLAGSAPRGKTPQEDRENAARLLASGKDRREHAVVVEAVGDALRPFCARLDVPAEPSLVATPSVWHLSTTVRGEVSDPDASSLELALALHPTPAVCGHPREAARIAIGNLEPFDRDLYAGLVGWSNACGDGEWAVALRCANVSGRDVRLYAGAGIVRGSKPESELAETAAKFLTMLDALGILPAQGEDLTSRHGQLVES